MSYLKTIRATDSNGIRKITSNEKTIYIIIIFGAILTACSTSQQNKTKYQMEPRILAIGRLGTQEKQYNLLQFSE